jgi:AcrR family transcriptional regulator
MTTSDQKRTPTTRDRLIKAAVTLGAREGMAAATTAAIAQLAGFAEGTLYRHFESKDDLLIAAYREMKAGIFLEAGRSADAKLSPPERLKLTWLGIYAAYRADIDAFRFGERFKESPLAEREGGEVSRTIAAMISDLVAEGVASGDFKDLPPELLTALSMAPLYFLLRTEINGRRWTNKELNAAADAVLDSWRK